MLLADRLRWRWRTHSCTSASAAPAREAQTLFRTAEQLVSTLHLDERVLIIARTLAMSWLHAPHLLRKAVRLIPERRLRHHPDEADALRAMDLDLLSLGGTIQRAVETGRRWRSPTSPRSRRIAASGLWHMRSALATLIVGTEVVGWRCRLSGAPARCRTTCACARRYNQAAVAIENARAFERERNVAMCCRRRSRRRCRPREGATPGRASTRPWRLRSAVTSTT